MSLSKWLSQSVNRIGSDGVEGVRNTLNEAHLGLIRRIAQLNYEPRPIWSRDWDVLIVLDACRYDLLTEVRDDYDFFGDINRFTSAGSSTTHWLDTNFNERHSAEMEDTAYITGNPNNVVLEQEFGYLDEVWQYAWDNDIGTVRPRPVTDRAIHAGRTREEERMIVHYLQPHHPFLAHPELDKGSYIGPGDERRKRSRTVWEKLESGELDEETVWDAYLRNLEIVLDDVELLLENLTADTVVITSDHGNALGEYGVYGHPRDVPISPLVEVPWSETSATDNHTHETDEYEADARATDEDVKSRLQDLGYH